MNRFGLHRNHESCLYKGSRFRASPRHSGQGFFWDFSVTARRGGIPSGAAAIIENNGYRSNNPASCMNNMIFTGVNKKSAEIHSPFFHLSLVHPQKGSAPSLQSRWGIPSRNCAWYLYFINSVRNSTKHFLICYGIVEISTKKIHR